MASITNNFKMIHQIRAGLLQITAKICHKLRQLRFPQIIDCSVITNCVVATLIGPNISQNINTIYSHGEIIVNMSNNS